jgi:L-fuconolactonase
MNRRQFATLLGGTALSAYAQQQAAPSSPVRQDWLDRRKEPILEPGLPIVDPHHHLWDWPG